MIINTGAGGASTAEAVQYDNSLSGLEADNVQGAVDELNDSLPTIDSGVTDLISLDAKKGADFSVNFNFEFENIPNVTLTAYANHANGMPIMRIKTVSTSGFTGRIYNDAEGNSVTFQIGWLAISK